MNILILLLMLCFGSFATHAQEADYIVGLKQDMPRRGKVKKEFTSIKAYHTKLSKKDADELRKDKRVKYVEENKRLTLDGVQENAIWNLARIDQRGALGTPPDTTYNYNTTGLGVTVYVIDTGVWLEHPEFEGRAIAGMGVDHSDMTTCGNGHGTHVAGTIASKTYGVAKKASIVSLRIATCAEPNIEVYKMMEALDWIAAQKGKPETRVVNISMTGPGTSQALNDAMDAVMAKKVLVVLSAGNSAWDACDFFPAGHVPAFTVGATWQEDAKALSSNYGPCIDLFAPGSEIVSTWNSSAALTNTLSGTSMAAPHVAGAAALYLEGHRRATIAELNSALLSNATQNALSSVGEGSPNSLLYSIFFFKNLRRRNGDHLLQFSVDARGRGVGN
jgi:subtilisin family serine protease